MKVSSWICLVNRGQEKTEGFEATAGKLIYVRNSDRPQILTENRIGFHIEFLESIWIKAQNTQVDPIRS